MERTPVAESTLDASAEAFVAGYDAAMNAVRDALGFGE